MEVRSVGGAFEDRVDMGVDLTRNHGIAAAGGANTKRPKRLRQARKRG